MALPSSTILRWYAEHARDLPWRRTRDPWAVLVSEVMLQQTPVARVLPVYREWMARWPSPGSLAAEPAGQAVREWGRLGYPRRALRLHGAAVAVLARHGGVVPSSLEDLLALPGVGPYTARAVASFAFGQRHPVVDTNVRRVLARAVDGVAAAGPHSEAGDLAACAPWVPAVASDAATFGMAVMELGALVCTARAPLCDTCPIAAGCAWRLAGRPPYTGPPRRVQSWTGTDRQARGALLAVLRSSTDAVAAEAFALAWADPVQRARALDSLLADGLVEPSAPSKPSNTSDTSEPSEPSDTSEPSEPSEPSERGYRLPV